MKEHQEATLDDQLNEFYGAVELPPEVVDEMFSHADRPRSVSRRVMLVGTAAAAVLAAFFGLPFFKGGDRKITELAMAEVARNHLNGIGPEAVSSDYAVVQEHLSRLTFPVEPPAGSVADGFDLIGGRYCKVQGEYAAQLKLQSREGGPPATAYVVPADGPLSTIKDASAVIDGVRVRCERVGDRLVFLAEEERAD